MVKINEFHDMDIPKEIYPKPDYDVKEDLKIDYLHIDAGHSYEDVKLDFQMYSSLLSEHGILSIHDTE